MSANAERKFVITDVKINDKNELELYNRFKKLTSFAGKQWKCAILGPNNSVFAVCLFGTICEINGLLQIKTFNAKVKNVTELDWKDNSLRVKKSDGSFDVFINGKLVDTILPPSATPTNTPTNTPSSTPTPTPTPSLRVATNYLAIKRIKSELHEKCISYPDVTQTSSATPTPTPTITPTSSCCLGDASSFVASENKLPKRGLFKKLSNMFRFTF
jgi:hypothetical protein